MSSHKRSLWFACSAARHAMWKAIDNENIYERFPSTLCKSSSIDLSKPNAVGIPLNLIDERLASRGRGYLSLGAHGFSWTSPRGDLQSRQRFGVWDKSLPSGTWRRCRDELPEPNPRLSAESSVPQASTSQAGTASLADLLCSDVDQAN